MDFTGKQRQSLAAKGDAEPDGSFPIRNVADLRRAIQEFGRSKDKKATQAFIVKRAKALGALKLLPESWGIPGGDTDTDDLPKTPAKTPPKMPAQMPAHEKMAAMQFVANRRK